METREFLSSHSPALWSLLRGSWTIEICRYQYKNKALFILIDLPYSSSVPNSLSFWKAHHVNYDSRHRSPSHNPQTGSSARPHSPSKPRWSNTRSYTRAGSVFFLLFQNIAVLDLFPNVSQEVLIHILPALSKLSSANIIDRAITILQRQEQELHQRFGTSRPCRSRIEEMGWGCRKKLDAYDEGIREMGTDRISYISPFLPPEICGGLLRSWKVVEMFITVVFK